MTLCKYSRELSLRADDRPILAKNKCGRCQRGAGTAKRVTHAVAQSSAANQPHPHASRSRDYGGASVRATRSLTKPCPLAAARIACKLRGQIDGEAWAWCAGLDKQNFVAHARVHG